MHSSPAACLRRACLRATAASNVCVMRALAPAAVDIWQTRAELRAVDVTFTIAQVPDAASPPSAPTHSTNGSSPTMASTAAPQQTPRKLLVRTNWRNGKKAVIGSMETEFGPDGALREARYSTCVPAQSGIPSMQLPAATARRGAGATR